MALGGLIGRLRWKGKAPPPGDRPIWAGQAFVPAEAGATAMRQAADAALRGDHTSACQFYAQARLAMGAGAEAWTLAAASHVARDETRIAVTLLMEARSLFLNDPKPSHDLAVLEEQREDWPAAERHWRDFIAIGETKRWAFARLANAVRRQGDITQADAVLQRVRKQLPHSSELAAETARLHQAEGRPAEALEAWHLIVAQFPQDWTGYHGVMTALLDLGRLGDAMQFVASHAVAFGESAEAQVDIAQGAERNADWKTAEAVWTRAVALGQSNDWAYRGLIRALRELGRSREADNAAERAVARHPGNASLLADVAESLEARGDYSRAAEVWHSAAALMPLESGYQTREAACLKSAEMPVPIAALESAPGTQSVSVGQDSGPATVSAGELDAAIVDDRTLMLQFESLGGTGHGCEFGIFQRRFGAEPLGLLRWADLDPDQLSNALETNLDGVGEPENTVVFIPENSEPAEY